MIILLCGLSGAGKTTLARNIKRKLDTSATRAEIIDGDEYRSNLFKELSFTRQDRFENIRRLGFIAGKFSKHGIVTIISAINPYAQVRNELLECYPEAYTVYVDCPINVLISRDTKGLYTKALLPDEHPDKISNLTGINDQFDVPHNPDLYINTHLNSVEECSNILYDFIINAKKPVYEH
ncbi:adenylyl-sulfate kinase [Mucilaginibacter psychrotolerans]|uniref:Adenylyl-sulfate kinase n=1 Tax=Mucilaginibacter psychrotolerans TaxID=1524096 RepID=A0A4Y8SMW3_9SPHI|nr:adenylyl-sulfate kinase [Mucilaginibacter psychrotolerans]TFF39706.1 adenylyl-sulfate kinase [Mucilaginibacter psychrotolerans]